MEVDDARPFSFFLTILVQCLPTRGNDFRLSVMTTTIGVFLLFREGSVIMAVSKWGISVLIYGEDEPI